MVEIISKPPDEKCPICGSYNIKIFHDMTGKDLGLFFLTIGLITQLTRHYLCEECKTIWRD
ncbi:MAG: hypothetical protein ACFFG0_09225 [Candidatus Thorarchaeota archaeon]